jgi:hypothetical protein
MKAELFLPVGVFLAVAIPVVWLLNQLDVGGDYKAWLAIAVGAIATGWTQQRLAHKTDHADQTPERQA